MVTLKVCGNIGINTPDSSLNAHKTLPRLCLAKDLIIGKSVRYAASPVIVGFAEVHAATCDLTQVVEERIGNLCLGGDDRGGECGRDRTGRSGSASLPRALSTSKRDVRACWE